MVRHPIRILGIDPGLRRTGWGLIETDGNRLIHVACGSLETSDRAALGERLVAIHDGLIAVIERFAPQEAAVEQTFVNTNAAATLKLGQARGIAMLVPARAGLTVAEYAPNVVKKTVVGAGHGEKAQIRMMIGVLLPKATPQSDDAADALAIAVCHAHHRTSVMRPELPPPERGRVGVGVNDDCERPSPGRFAVDLPLAGGGKQKGRAR